MRPILFLASFLFLIAGFSQVTIGGKTKLCADGELYLVAAGDSVYKWVREDAPEVVLSTTNTLEDNPSYSQNYLLFTSVDTMVINVFVGTTNCNCQVYIPNIFTPDGDSFNDDFVPVINCEVQVVRTTIYDRTNRVVYDSSDLNPSWDGTDYLSGNTLAIGVFVYQVSTLNADGQKKSYIGYVILAR